MGSCQDCRFEKSWGRGWGPAPPIARWGCGTSPGASRPTPSRTTRPACPACGFTGFRGRIPVAELLIPDDAFEDLLAGDAARPHLAAHLSRCGHHSLLADAREIERRGLSTRDEIEAVVGPLDRP